MRYYVYVLYDGDVPFYVGKGTGDRMIAHDYYAGNQKKKSSVLSKIRKMKSLNLPITREKVFENDNPVECFKEEIRLIAHYGRKDKGLGPLCNLTDGGEGIMGYEFTDEHRTKISEALIKAYSEGRTGLPKAWLKHLTTEYKEKHRKSMLDLYQSDKGQELKEHKRLVGKAKLINGKRVLSEEARQKMRDSAKRTNELRKNKHNIS